MMKIKKKHTAYKIKFDKPKAKIAPNGYQNLYSAIAAIDGIKNLKYDNFDNNKIHIKVDDYHNFDEVIHKIEKIWEMKW